jgi:acetyl-CoA C-acetyltransferase
MPANSKYPEVFILSAARTPSGAFQGGLSSLSAVELGSIVIREAVSRSGVEDLTEIDEVLMGNVVSAGLGQAPARQASIRGGLPASVGATSLNKVCGSGLKTVMLAAQAVKLGEGQLYVCLLYTSPSPRDRQKSRMPSSA